MGKFIQALQDLEAMKAERDALAATVKELLGCLASADWDSHEMDDARRLLESLSSAGKGAGRSLAGSPRTGVSSAGSPAPKAEDNPT